jgi:release factor glutamine methyltransferase
VLSNAEGLLDKGLKYDRIISNPPYIPFRESASMEINVLNFEPELALFVPNDNPLLFYKRIMDVSMLLLNENGCLFLEIHENYAFEISGLLKENGFINIELRKDLQGKPRMIKAKKATFIV